MKFPRHVENLIATFRGLPPNRSRARDRAGINTMGSLVDNCIDRYQIGQDTAEEIILSNWPRIVGKVYARRCKPERIDRSGALIIAVTNTTLRRELQFMEDRILTATRSLEGCEKVTSIGFKAG